MSPRAQVDGVTTDRISVFDRGLAYGDGVFETMRAVGARVLLRELHLDRLREGCRRLAIALDGAALRSQLDQALRDTGDDVSGIVKLIVTRGIGQRGYQAPKAVQPTLVIQCLPAPEYPSAWYTAGVKTRLADIRLSCNPRLAGIKHLNRLEQVLARMEWSTAECFESLLLDEQGRLIEGVMSNVFLVIDDALLTPALHRCGVAGVMRRHIMATVAPRLGVAVTVTDLTLDDFYRADEVFLANSVFGILPVNQLGCVYKNVGVLTSALHGALLACWGDS